MVNVGTTRAIARHQGEREKEIHLLLRGIHFDHDDEGEGEQALMARSGRMLNEEVIFDSGATAHMIGNRKLMNNFISMPAVMISLGDGSRVHSKKKGDVTISISRGNSPRLKLILSNVMHVLHFDINTLS